MKNGCPESSSVHGKGVMVSTAILKEEYRTDATIFQLEAQVIGITEIYIEEEQKAGLRNVHSVQMRFIVVGNGLHISQVIVG